MQACAHTRLSLTVSTLIMHTTPEQILDIKDALVSDENPARDEDTLDFERCARLHNYLVAYTSMARNGTNTPDLDALASESWFFNQPNENIDAIRARLDPSLNSFLDSIYHPAPGFFYWVSRLRMELADESFPLEDNDFEDKERFVEWLIFVGGEKNIIEPEEEPVHQRAGNPNQIEQRQEKDSFSCESSGGVF